MQSIPAASRAYDWMDALRMLAAVVVLLNHVRDLLWVDYNGERIWAPVYFMAGYGHEAVMIFFVLSGFWITGSVMRRIDRPDFWQRYMLDRLSRLYVVLIPALLLGGVLDYVGSVVMNWPLYSGESGAHTVEMAVRDRLGLGTLLINLAFLQGLVGPTFGSNGPLWSLAYEFWFYAWFPAIAFVIVQRRFTLIAVSLLLAWFYPQVTLGFMSWLMGTALYFAIIRYQSVMDRIGAKPKRWLAGMLLLNLVVLLYTRTVAGAASDLLVAVCFTGLLFVAISATHWLPSAPRFLVLLGKQGSFSLYAIHFPIAIFVCSALLAMLGGERLQPSFASLGAMVAIMVTIVGIAYYFAKLTEARTPLYRDRATRSFARFYPTRSDGA
ncbi:acyltransferase [Croceicoccus sp. YJ47]|uniref:acyltransferase family protein n=1 Tax=Croceicoccus sp. YJ47 TaxID=2798724 RepID=UPI0019205DD4|nr:acyltransferase [Croceicoccus sp. YJ47]QQN72988.1 acyltransferase [Croceicoccus sp. YJ47]